MGNVVKPNQKQKLENKDYWCRPFRLDDRYNADYEEYRRGFPSFTEDDESKQDNYLFYTNQISSKPNGAKIEDMHREWRGRYARLEDHHGYIQWLFPQRESGMNDQVHVLQPHEIKKIMGDSLAISRILTSYHLMLDFYGMQLKDDGTITRSANWKDRFENLRTSFHNFLRISRILKCLGEFGYEHLKEPLIWFILREAFQGDRPLYCVHLVESLCNFWIQTIKDDAVREELFNETIWRIREAEEGRFSNTKTNK